MILDWASHFSNVKPFERNLFKKNDGPSVPSEGPFFCAFCQVYLTETIVQVALRRVFRWSLPIKELWVGFQPHYFCHRRWRLEPNDTPQRQKLTMAKTTTRFRESSSASQTPLETYLREINETSLLTANEEKELARRIELGDSGARDRMVRANLRLVVNIARAYANRGLPLQDLIEEGNLGLLRAVEGFDPDMNTRFSTYASYWIKQSIKRALINTGKTIRIPAYMVELLTKWRRATAKLDNELGRAPTQEEVAKELGLPKKKLSIVKTAIDLYMSTPQTDDDDGGWQMSEMVADQRTKGPEDDLLDADNLKHVYRILETMDPREASILRMRFGLDDAEPKTLKEIGELLGLTRERVRQIESDALKRIAREILGE